jgi:hypothetical protein
MYKVGVLPKLKKYLYSSNYSVAEPIYNKESYLGREVL